MPVNPGAPVHPDCSSSVVADEASGGTQIPDPLALDGTAAVTQVASTSAPTMTQAAVVTQVAAVIATSAASFVTDVDEVATAAFRACEALRSPGRRTEHRGAERDALAQCSRGASVVAQATVVSVRAAAGIRSTPLETPLLAAPISPIVRVEPASPSPMSWLALCGTSNAR